MGYYGILASFHNLLLPAVQLFTKGTMSPHQPISMDDQQRPLPMVQDQHEDKDAEELDVPEGPSDHITAESVATGDVDWSQVARCMKDRFTTWVSLKPRDALIVMRLGTLPCYKLLHSLLDRGSKGYEHRQRLLKLKTGTRLYQAQEAARGTLLDSFFELAWQCFEAIPEALPAAGCTMEMQCLHFRILSAGVCCVQHVIGKAWDSYPIKLFRALDQHFDFLTDPACLLDPLSKAFREVCQGVTVAEFQSLLASVASEFTLDIAAIEAKHASTRRILHTRHVQVKVPTLEDVSAGWVLRNNVLSRENVARSSAQPDPEPKHPKPSKQKPWKRAQSPWNAFFHQYFSGQHGDASRNRWGAHEMSRCSEAYSRLTEKELAALTQQASEAQLRVAFGHRSFTPAAFPRSAQPAPATVDLTDAVVDLTEHENMLVPATAPNTGSDDCVDTAFHDLKRQLAVISSEQFHESRARIANAQVDSQELADFRHSPELRQCFHHVLGIVPDALETVSPFPADMPSVDLHLPERAVEDWGGMQVTSGHGCFSGK